MYTKDENNQNKQDYFRVMGIRLEVKENENTHTITNGADDTIEINGEKGIGIYSLGKNVTITNNGKIYIIDINAVGIEINGEKSIAHNNQFIKILGDSSTGMKVTEKGIAINEKDGTIEVNGNNGASGMFASGSLSQVINRGNIRIDGENAAGIRVSNSAKGFNETSGVIVVRDSAFGMYAESGGRIENKGVIALIGKNKSATGMYSTGDNSFIINKGQIILLNELAGDLAINATEGGKYINEGKIIGKGDIEIGSDRIGQFIVGTQANGDIGTVRSRKIKIKGNVVASKDLIKNNKKEILYKDVFVAPIIEIDKDISTQNVSLFYNSQLKTNESGNVDIEVSRNGNSLKKIYKSKNFNSLITQLDGYLNTENINLSKDEMILSDKILKSSDSLEIKKAVKNLSGEIYTNIPRQIFDIQERLLKEDKKLMNSLNDHSYNFNFFSGEESIENKEELSGYKIKTSGFVGMKRTVENFYASIGYEHGGIKYNEGSKGTIQTIHTGIYKNLFLNEYDINIGIRGDYSFHKTNRKLNQFNRIGKVKDNESYTIGTNSEITRTFGDIEKLYTKPFVGLNLTYGKYNQFKEINAGELGVSLKGEDYLSVLPNIGFKVGKNFQNIKLYSNIIHSHELGNLNKNQNVSLLNNKINYNLSSNILERRNTKINIGTEMTLNDFNATFEVGKELGKRDNKFFTLSLGYKF